MELLRKILYNTGALLLTVVSAIPIIFALGFMVDDVFAYVHVIVVLGLAAFLVGLMCIFVANIMD